MVRSVVSFIFASLIFLLHLPSDDLLLNIKQILQHVYCIQDVRSLVNAGPTNSKDIATRWTIEAALQTPMPPTLNVEHVEAALQTQNYTRIPRIHNSDSAVGTEESSEADRRSANYEINRVGNNNYRIHGYADSAVGTGSQMGALSNQSSPIFLNRLNDTQCQASLDPTMTMTQDSQLFLSSQDMFSQCLVTPSMDGILADRRNECSNFHQSANDCFHNFVTSLDNTHSTQRTNDTSLANHSFYSIMQRSLMRENLQQPCSSVQLALVTPSMTQLHPTQCEEFSQFVNNSTFPRNGTSWTNFRIDDLSQEIGDTRAASGNFSASNNDSHRRLIEENLQSQLYDVLTARSIFTTQNQGQHQQSFQSQCSNQSDATPLIPRSIRDLYEQIKSTGLSDWSFVFALSAQTCQEFMPMNYAITLKTSLLPSIASIDTNTDVAPIPIVAVGRDSSSVNSIMSYMGNFAQRFLSPTDHTFNVMINSEKVVEVGPVFLAKNGVCYLGDWSGLSKKVSDEIKILIDSGRYFFNETSENFQLGSALWTYWSSTQNKKDISSIVIFVKYFGIPTMTDCIESDDIIEFLLLEAKEGKLEVPNDVLNISNEDMKKYLNIVRKMKVRRSDEAQHLLKAYTDTIQQDRAGLLSARSFQVIQQMAESFAKLCLRNNVLVQDVVSAISIAEKTFYAITQIARAPLLSPTQDIAEVDQYIQTFHKWIFNYVGMLR